ncbi:hypothetical protein M5689_008957 [Euphorbia peplus]|nr:hypothetical protein M5689_008957 [Euphorbia peplus]
MIFILSLSSSKCLNWERFGDACETLEVNFASCVIAHKLADHFEAVLHLFLLHDPHVASLLDETNFDHVFKSFSGACVVTAGECSYFYSNENEAKKLGSKLSIGFINAYGFILCQRRGQKIICFCGRPSVNNSWVKFWIHEWQQAHPTRPRVGNLVA